MSDNLGGGVVELGFAVWDSTQAALVGLNPVPILITAGLIGLSQPQRGWYFVKALIALVPAVVMAALWPTTMGYTPIWPDPTQMEAQIQLVIQLAVAWVMIALISLIKSTLSVSAREPQPRPNGH